MGKVKPIYERLEAMSKTKLDKMEYEHRQHLTRFTQAKDSKADLVQRSDDKYQKLVEKAKKELQQSVPLALGTAMQMRQVRADNLIAKSVLTLLRANQFYHRMMIVLIQDTKAGVEYHPDRVKHLIPAEFNDMFDKSILSTNLEGLLGELKSELDEATEVNQE